MIVPVNNRINLAAAKPVGNHQIVEPVVLLDIDVLLIKVGNILGFEKEPAKSSLVRYICRYQLTA